MSNMLSTGVSGLLAFQSALDTIGNNISNVNTPGYDRESVDLVTNPATPAPNGWIGNGVSVASVTRAYDSFLAAQANGATSSYNQFNTLSTLAAGLSNLLGDPTTGLSATLQSFSGALQNLADAPSDSATRQAVLSQLQTLVSQFGTYQSTFDSLGQQVNGSVSAAVDQISSLAQSIAGLNQQITAAEHNGTGQPPNQLLDQRDLLIHQLAQQVGVTTVAASDGSINVFIGNGQPLVVGAHASTLTAGADAFDSGRLQISMHNGSSSGSVDVTGSLAGGTLGGLLQFQDQMLVPGENALGQAAVTLSTLLNTQNAAGLDLNGQPGGALLTVGGAGVLPSASNTGSAQISAQISDLSALGTSNDLLRYDGSAWSLVDATSGAAVPLSSSTAGGVTTLTGAGLTLTVTGAAAAGDQFLVEPTGSAVAGLALATDDPSAIAAAAPLVASAAAGNTGSGAIQSATVPDSATWTRGNYTLSFGSGATYTVTDASGATVDSGSYAAGTPIDFEGIEVTLTGTPAAGDSFTIDDNGGGIGDNRNALLLAGVVNQKVLDGGNASLADAVAGYVGTVGTQTAQAQNAATAQQGMLASAQSAQQSVSGVNLDEEAANMVKFEQAYQAAAQIISASNTLFSSLLSAVQTG